MRQIVRTLALPAFLLLAASGTVHADFWGSLGRIFGRASTDTSAPSPGSPLPGTDSGTITALMRAMAGFSEAEEIAIGHEVSGRLLGAAPLVADTVLQHFVNRVGRWVALQSERPDLPWRFGVIESEGINAFAAPGGAILLTRGLYRTLRSESELAGVLAHEIAHVVARHHLKVLQQGTLLDAGARALASRSGTGEELRRWIGTGAELFARGLDRNVEHEADRMAVVLAGRAGYEPFGLPAVLEAIGHSAAGDTRVALLFETHPRPADRITHLRSAIGDRFDRIEGAMGHSLVETTAVASAP